MNGLRALLWLGRTCGRGLLVLLAVLVLGASSAGAAEQLRWGLDLEGGAPYGYADPANPARIIGFEREIADELGKRIGRTFLPVQVNWDSLIPALSRNTIDVAMAGIEITDDHQRGALFTRPYCVYQQRIAVRKGEGRIQVFEDLKGMKVGTVTSTAAHRELELLGEVDIKHYTDMFAVYEDLAIGRLDAVYIDQPVADFYAGRNPSVRFIEPPRGVGYYGIALRKSDEELKRELDKAIGSMIDDGSLQRILERWNLWNPLQEKLAEYRDDQPLSRMDGPGIGQYLPVLLQGAWMTCRISVSAMLLAMAVGMLLALGRVFGPTPVRWLATGYVEIVRGTPLLIQLYMLYYALPKLGIELDAFVAGVMGLGLNYAANEAENYRAGLQAVPRGQHEACAALGMTRMQAIRHVILPQSLRVTIPPVTNDFIALFKDSSLVSVITLVELTKSYGMLASATYDYVRLGLLTAALYLAISYPAALLARWTEARLQRT
ncbi:MAG: ABC transporter substrate-binding protein/permease [Candidatus Sericytochromatia bacterium]|nr:ABC transporter substrate-binding protein/permease [Candidatus Sericytochromatia bacterium]